MKGPSANPWHRIQWVADDMFRVNGVDFDLVSWGSPRKQSSPEKFVLVKDPPFIDSMKAILDGVDVRKSVEFGLYHGGSMVLLDALYGLETAVGIDDRSEMPALFDYIANNRADGRLYPYLSTDQSDAKAISAILERHYRNRDLDLIIDDASHLYRNSRVSFETSFDYLRPGGIYVIEDWGWAHWKGDFQEREYFPGEPLSKLVMELLMCQATTPELFDHIYIDYHHVAVVKAKTPWRNAMKGGLASLYLTKREIRLAPPPAE